jgi:DNA-binding NarL/FixJ family response regulator
LPTSKDIEILCGEDLGRKIKDVLPKTKIIISTMLNDNYRVYCLLKSLNPEGFLIKSDLTPNILIAAIDAVLKSIPYYSQSVLKLLRKQVSNDVLLDTIDRKILFELSIGTKMNEIPNALPLSIAGIEKRKRRLKQVFDMKTSSDKELLHIAREKGFI